MLKKCARGLLGAALLIICLSGFAGGEDKDTTTFATPYHFYVGFTGGYGSTDWGMLVAQPGSLASYVSPIAADDTGGTVGATLGYQFSQMFALELGYTRFATANVKFDVGMPYWNYDDVAHTLKTNTNAFDFVGKFIVPVKGTKSFHAFASAGLGVVNRVDELVDTSHVGAAFGVGMIFDLSKHITAEGGFQYLTGFGRANDGPVYKYVPFLYQGYFNVAYHFDI